MSISLSSRAHTQGHVRMRWRTEEPPDSPRATKGTCGWTKTHITNTAATHTLCGLEVPDMPHLQDIAEEIPASWPVCKRCQRTEDICCGVR